MKPRQYPVIITLISGLTVALPHSLALAQDSCTQLFDSLSLDAKAMEQLSGLNAKERALQKMLATSADDPGRARLEEDLRNVQREKQGFAATRAELRTKTLQEIEQAAREGFHASLRQLVADPQDLLKFEILRSGPATLKLPNRDVHFPLTLRDSLSGREYSFLYISNGKTSQWHGLVDSQKRSEDPTHYLVFRHGSTLDQETLTAVDPSLTALSARKADFALPNDTLDRLAYRTEHSKSLHRQFYSLLAVKKLQQTLGNSHSTPLIQSFVDYLALPQTIRSDSQLPLRYMLGGLSLPVESQEKLVAFHRLLADRIAKDNHYPSWNGYFALLQKTYPDVAQKLEPFTRLYTNETMESALVSVDRAPENVRSQLMKLFSKYPSNQTLEEQDAIIQSAIDSYFGKPSISSR